MQHGRVSQAHCSLALGIPESISSPASLTPGIDLHALVQTEANIQPTKHTMMYDRQPIKLKLHPLSLG
jgi:hypothetical protein